MADPRRRRLRRLRARHQRGSATGRLDGVHLCNVRLRLLRLNTMGALDPALLADVAALSGCAATSCASSAGSRTRCCGAAASPASARSAGTRRSTSRPRASAAPAPERIGFYLTSRGMPNESYYAAQKAARAIGTNSIDNAARVCHSPTTFGLKEALGVARDDLLLHRLDRHRPDRLHRLERRPTTSRWRLKYLHHAKKAGTRVVVRQSVPRARAWSATGFRRRRERAVRDEDRRPLLRASTSAATSRFLTGVLKHLIERGWVDERLRRRAHDRLRRARATTLARPTGTTLEAGRRRARATRCSSLARDARRGASAAVLVWSMGVTQHARGEDNVRAIVNLGAGARLRRPRGLRADADPRALRRAGRRRDGLLRDGAPGRRAGRPGERGRARRSAGASTCPTEPGPHGAGDARRRARAASSTCSSRAGGNFLEVLPDPGARPRERWSAIPLRVHMDIVLSSQMLVEPGEAVLLLPATTRYEIPGGVTETSTERRVISQPEIAGPRIAEARAEWEVFGELAARVRPELAEARALRRHAGDPRGDRARSVPLYARDRGAARAGRLSSSTAGRGCATAGELPDRRRPRALRAGRRRRRRSPGDGSLRALDAPRQAVQLDGPERRTRSPGATARRC